MFSSENPSSVGRLSVLKVQERQTIAIELLSGDWVRLVTHYHVRTFLCSEGESCHVCELQAPRAYWYLPVVATQSKRVHLLELSSSASADLEQKCRFCGSAPRAGVQMEVSRRTKKSPLRFEFAGNSERPKVAKIHEWVSPLMALYRLPPLAPGETLAEYGLRVSSSVVERTKLAAAEIRAAAERGVRSRVTA